MHKILTAQSTLCFVLFFFSQTLSIYISLNMFAGFREDRQSLTLLELPSIFTPEDWSFTFFEGINRLPDSVFTDRDIAELGCGNGWISIAIAEKWSPRKVEVNCLMSMKCLLVYTLP